MHTRPSMYTERHKGKRTRRKMRAEEEAIKHIIIRRRKEVIAANAKNTVMI